MKKHELLVPVGNMECLYQAVSNGCDAVYMGCKTFGARKYAQNFTNDEVVKAIKYCHLYGVKIYITMNTLIKNNEVKDFINQAKFLYQNGVDALIVQDFGMICLLREKFPELEIHASTQANISSKEVCKLYYELGVKRIVFARELTIDEINSIDVPIEKEAFIHGALCISYSGCCLMSSMLGGRSGNRGECAGCCRMPFTLEKNNKKVSNEEYLLSTKELNTSQNIQKILDSDIYSLKIEGRMKSPLYVGFITKYYRKLIDGEEFNLEKETDKLKTIFNREFTKGRMFNESDKNLMNTKTPNHIGLEIGKVTKITKNKIKIELDDDYEINQYDAIRFLNNNKGFIINFLYDENMKLINKARKVCYVDNKIDLSSNDIVCKTQDYLLEKEFLNINEKKIKIDFIVNAKQNEKLEIEIDDGINKIKSYGSIIEKSINSPTTEADIIKQLSKLGNTPFMINSIKTKIDENIFISLRELNEIRRELVSKLIIERENKHVDIIENEIKIEKENDKNNSIDKTSCLVNNKEQLDTCINLEIDRIYITDKEIYDLYKNTYNNVYYVIPRCILNIKDEITNQNLASDYNNYNDNDNNVIGNYPLNITNIYTAYYLKKIGINNICLSVELSEEELLNFIEEYEKKFGKRNFEIFGYGRVENMIIKGNILNLSENEKDYKLVDFKKRKFPVYYDGRITHILNYENKILDKKRFTNKCTFRYEFFDETKEEIINIVKKCE